MVTLVTRILIILQATAALGLCWAALRYWQVGSPWLAAAIGAGAILLFRLLITANNFWIAWLYRSETPKDHQLRPLQALRLFAGEFLATMKSSTWTMAFHQFEKHEAEKPAGLPVLLIHGYGCNSGYWHGMSQALQRAKIYHHAVSLEPMFGGIDDFVPSIGRAVESLRRSTGSDKIVIVAHSMGGLVARAYIRDHGYGHIAKVITLGTPHSGTALANFGAGHNSRQMRWTGSARTGKPSRWLAELALAETPEVRGLFVSIYSHHDNIVSPQTSSDLPGARNVELHGIGHVALALHPVVQAIVVEEVLAAGAGFGAESKQKVAPAPHHFSTEPSASQKR
ncbi:MAG: alpha/beta fold hydrolase [Herminiimonas sp.]|nr:alpha/beta fold hydrolase [Herminiimonas sp.]